MLFRSHPLHGAMLSLSGSMISILFFSDAPFINALIAASVFPFLALPLMITIFMRVSSNFRFYFVTMTFPSESRRGVIAAPYPDFQQR